MTGQIIGQIILWLIIVVIIVFIAYFVMHWLYRRSSKEVAFVRTGFLGEKVVIDGGALVWPIVNEITPVNMNSIDLLVTREQQDSLVTKDRMRVDIVAEFYVRVGRNQNAVSLASSTLGRRTLQPENIRRLLEGKFISALRTGASELTLSELHENRKQYVERVHQLAQEGLDTNGLELETIALINLDQTDIEYFNPSNQFDAEGLTSVIEVVESRRKMRNDIEQDTATKIRQRNLQSEKETLEIEREKEVSRLDQEQSIEFRRAQQQATVVSEQSTRKTESEKSRIESERAINEMEIEKKRTIKEAEITSEEEIEKTQIASNKKLETARTGLAIEQGKLAINKEQDIEIARIEKVINLSQKSLEESSATITADTERAKAIEATEKVKTAQEMETINRKSSVDLEITRTKASEIQILAEAEKARATIEAESKRMINEAENVLTDEARHSLFKHKMLEYIEGIISASVKPLEHINDIRIVELGGTNASAKNSGPDSKNTGTPSPTDEVINSALRYRVQAPMVDSLLSDIGIDGSNIAKSGGLLREAADLSRIENERQKSKNSQVKEQDVSQSHELTDKNDQSDSESNDDSSTKAIETQNVSENEKKDSD